MTNTQLILEKIEKRSSFNNKDWKNELDNNGYIVVENSEYMENNLRKLQEVSAELLKSEGDKGGWEGKEKYFKPGKKFESGAQRLGGLVNKDKSFLGLISIPEILLASHHVIQNEIKICGMNLRNPNKGMGEQCLHIDGFPRNTEQEEFAGIVAFIYLDNATLSNGAMRIVPKSHKKLGWPDDHVDISKLHSAEKRLEVKAGTIVVANLNIWHAGAKNETGASRRVIMLNIKNRKYDQLLNYKRYLSKEFVNGLNEDQKYLLSVRNSDMEQKLDSGGSANQLRREYFKKKNNKFTSVANN